MAASCSRFKGTMYFFAYDFASGGHHQKLAFIESVLQGEGIEPHVHCSDPSVDIAFTCGEKKGLLMIVAPPPGELSDGFETRKKEVIIKADLKEMGFSAANLKLTNIMSGEHGEVLKIASKDLKEGMPMKLSFPDGLVFLVEKR